MNCVAAVLAGGRSLRMGQEKAFIPLNGRTLIETVIGQLRPSFETVYILANASNAYESLGCPVVPDQYPNCGPMGALATGLLKAGRPLFAVGCDMPFLNGNFVSWMVRHYRGEDALVPHE